MGKKGKKKDFSTKEKELLEIENLKLQKREKQTSRRDILNMLIRNTFSA